jgi:hypothetical protein
MGINKCGSPGLRRMDKSFLKELEKNPYGIFIKTEIINGLKQRDGFIRFTWSQKTGKHGVIFTNL